MSRSAVRAVLALLAATGLVAVIATDDALTQSRPPTTSPATQQRRVFRGGVNLVTVDAYPRRNGRIVEGLTPEDFEVFEDGTPQAIDQFEFVRIEADPMAERIDPNSVQESFTLAADPHRRVFVTFLDVYHVPAAGGHLIRRPLVEFMRRALGPDDLFGVMTARIPVAYLTLMRKTASIEDHLAEHWTWGLSGNAIPDADSPGETLLVECFGGGPGIAELLARYREDITFRRLHELVQYLGHIRQARTVLIVVSDGWSLFRPTDRSAEMPRIPAVGVRNGRLGIINDSAPGRPNDAACTAEANRLYRTDGFDHMRAVIDRANESNVTFYPISTRGVGGSSQRMDTLLTIANNTGGTAIVNTNDLTQGVARIAADTSAYYLLGYYSTNAKNDGQVRQIKVRVKQPNTSVTARRGYRAPSAKDAAATADLNRAKPEPPDEIRTALGLLTRGADATDLLAYGVQWAGADELAIVAELSASLIERGGWPNGGAVEVTIVGEGNENLGTTTGRIAPGSRSALVRVPLQGNLGIWRATVRVRGEAGVLTERVIVRPADGTLLGEPVAFRGGPAARTPVVPVADFYFRRTETFRIEWPLLQPVDRRQARLLDTRGQPLPVTVALTERDQGGQKLIAADLALAPLGAGDYVLHLTAGAGTQTEDRYVAIRVLR